MLRLGRRSPPPARGRWLRAAGSCLRSPSGRSRHGAAHTALLLAPIDLVDVDRESAVLARAQRLAYVVPKKNVSGTLADVGIVDDALDPARCHSFWTMETELE
ncbi:hypothetical protein PG985_009303 [Apiospora marii]|uniref:uncharacterized protein n=1 Tax=Apiospora marii TaxID=335849 RepID=UPI0031306D10